MKKYIAQIVQNDEVIEEANEPCVTKDDAMRNGIDLIQDINSNTFYEGKIPFDVVDADDIILVEV